MQTDAMPRRTGGRLSREDQRRLGDILQRMYDDVLRQGVPDRFRDLLNELEEEGDATHAIPASPQAESASDSDRLMEVKGLGNPVIKGPH
jgi:hypothetical protein